MAGGGVYAAMKTSRERISSAHLTGLQKVLSSTLTAAPAFY